MNSLQLKFLMRGPHNDLVYIESCVDPEVGKNLIVRACDKNTFELSSILDAEVFSEYYAIALLEINKMLSFTFIPSYVPKAFVRIDNGSPNT